tara:strand:+ start:290 stop:1630 length:1341 start_codon:yes stop_codon:yes gene_type:complete
MKISIIGSGYVGLVSGLCLSEIGHDVTCIDNQISKVRKINNGISPIYEKGINKLLIKNLKKNFRASTNLKSAVQETDVSIIAVGTPFKKNKIDISYVKEAAKQIALAIKEKEEFHTIIVKSTVVPGTTDEIVSKILESHSKKILSKDFGLSMNPEFLREGEAINDFLNPDRIVIGSSDSKTKKIVSEIYKAFINVDILKTNNKTAELIKYTSNSLLASLISFSNEIANLSDKIGGIDVKEVMKGLYLDKRFSPKNRDGKRIFPSSLSYIESGCGFGGSCFPKDVRALISHGKRKGENMKLLEAVMNINDEQPKKMINILKKSYPKLSKINVAVLGLAFKPGTDDIRESPSLKVIDLLLKYNISIRAYDPIALKEAKKSIKNSKVYYKTSIKSAIRNVDAIMIMTKWSEFKNIDRLINNLCPNALVIDGRRILKPKSIKNYRGIGLS